MSAAVVYEVSAGKDGTENQITKSCKSVQYLSPLESE